MLENVIKLWGHECIFFSETSLWVKSNWNGEYLNALSVIQRLRDYIYRTGGGCKYGYHEVEKKTFQEAKDVVNRYLEVCPKEVISRFINWSWRFMSVYCLALTGHTAVWAVKKQKQHHQVSQRVMMSIEAVLNTSWMAACSTRPCESSVNLAHIKPCGNLLKRPFSTIQIQI